MASTAIQTVFCWSKESDVACVEFWRNEDYYVFSATPDTLRQMLRLVGVCAGDPKLNLTWDDAAQITATLRVLVTEVEPTVHVTSYEQAVDAVVESCDVRWLGWLRWHMTLGLVLQLATLHRLISRTMSPEGLDE